MSSSKPFPGFPAKAKFTPLPNVFFSHLSPQIDSLAELKVILHIFWLLYQKRGHPKFVTFEELLGDKTLATGIKEGADLSETLRQALAQAVQRGVLLHLHLKNGERQRELYFLNTEVNRRAIARIKSGEMAPGEAPPPEEPPLAEEKPNIFTLYEQNIGLLTPLLAEELKEAEKLYPASWIEEAFKQAVALNRRSWRYIARILERWAEQGKTDGEPGRHIKKEIDPDKYIKGRYGYLVQR